MDEQDNAFPQDGWECTGCAEDYTIAADGQPFEIGAGEYCLNCIEDHFRPIANFGDEENGIPRIEDDVLEERRDILVAMDPDLLARYRRQMVPIRACAPLHRVFCSNIVNGTQCNQFICKRQKVTDDRTHQWRECDKCEEAVCTACETVHTTEDDHAQDCSEPAWLANWMQHYYSDERGGNWQICPACDRIADRTGGCNAMACVCGCKYCLVCGRQFQTEDEMFHHNNDVYGCPLMSRPDNPAEYHPNTWEDPRNYGGYDQPPLDDWPSEWRDSAIQVTYLDREYRQTRRLRTANEFFPRLLLHARQLLIRAHNRKGSGYPSLTDFGMIERLRFTLEASQFRARMLEMRRDDRLRGIPQTTPVAALLPNGTARAAILWDILFQRVRPLCFRDGAVHRSRQERGATFDRLLHHLVAAVQETPAILPPQAGPYWRTYELANLCWRLIGIVHSRKSWRFSASLGFYISGLVLSIKDEIDKVENIGCPVFFAAREGNETLYEIARFLAYRTFQEDDSELHMHSDRISWLALTQTASSNGLAELAMAYNECAEEQDILRPDPNHGMVKPYAVYQDRLRITQTALQRYLDAQIDTRLPDGSRYPDLSEEAEELIDIYGGRDQRGMLTLGRLPRSQVLPLIYFLMQTMADIVKGMRQAQRGLEHPPQNI